MFRFEEIIHFHNRVYDVRSFPISIASVITEGRAIHQISEYLQYTGMFEIVRIFTPSEQQ